MSQQTTGKSIINGKKLKTEEILESYVNLNSFDACVCVRNGDF